MQASASKMLDLQRSVVDLCAGFVVIDNGGNITMIHQTAREYLLSTNLRPFHIDKHNAHKQIFLSCMSCLMTIGLRAKLKGTHRPELLSYAAQSWSSHLISCPIDDEDVNEVLKNFLGGNWVLTWIQVLAISGQLRVLVQASKHLSKYSARRKNRGISDNDKGHEIIGDELIDSWADDFTKIVGKFGTVLERSPEAIYRLIPPFCPSNSAIHQQFGKLKDKSLIVSGLSNGNWDDSLARMSFGFGTYASSISANGPCIAVLIPPGIVMLYDSSTFMEYPTSPIKHGERVFRMELNTAGTLLATYGYLTTKIWETTTGNCKITIGNIESRPRPLTLLLASSSTTLVVGSDDRRIRSLDLNHTNPTWQLVAELEEPELEGHFLNSANYMTLNKEGSLAAIAYRGHPLSAWETDGPIHIGHCWRKRNELARGEVIDAVWHPHYPQVLGLYIEGVVFKWHPYDDEVDEMATGASKLAISRDGKAFATGDVRGAVKVYTTSDFALLYQLSSEDMVLGIAFSPDLRRFYDIRGHYGTAWEPNALLKYADQRGIESASETSSVAQTSMVSENRTLRVDSITCLASSPAGCLYCCGTENGIVHLHHTQKGKVANLHVSTSFSSIEQMEWSNEGRFFCFSDSNKKIFVLSIIEKLDPVVEAKAELPMKTHLNGPVLQLLFNPDSSQLLVRTSSTMCTVSLQNFSVLKLLEITTEADNCIPHPLDSSLIVVIGPVAIRILDWSLNQRRVYTLDYANDHEQPKLSKSALKQASIGRVLVTQDKRCTLVQMSVLNLNSKEKIIFHLQTSQYSASTANVQKSDPESEAVMITPALLSRSLSSQITLALALLSCDNLVLLSKDFSVYTWQFPFSLELSSTSSLLPTRAASLIAADKKSATQVQHRNINDAARDAGKVFKLMFSLPGDWISRDCLAMCNFWPAERSLLCPRNGEVGVVRCTALV